MSRARTSSPPDWQTAAAENGSGCLSGFLLPPLAVLVIGLLLAILAINLTTPVQATTAPQPQTASQSQTSAAVLAGNLSPIFTPEVQFWASSIQTWATETGLDPNLIATVMQIESCGDPRARSRAGAMGLFQVMPYHFADGDDPYAPDTNALRGLAYLQRSLTAAGGSARLALAGYNGGIGVIARAESGWAAETLRYVQYGSPIYEDASRGQSASPALDEWYQRYGAGLCRQAHQHLGLP
jgi:soluble lytic murein transglycosylase-like protein